MKHMFFKKILGLSLVTFKLRDRRFSKSQKIHIQGFTLIELLVVMIVIGILAAIAVPSFLNQAQKAKFAEAKSYVFTMSRLQQAYYMEKSTFTDDISRLSLGINTSSASYTYYILTGNISGTTSPVQLDRIATNVAEPKTSGGIAFASVVAITALNSATVLFDTALCTANFIGAGSIAVGLVSPDGLTAKCPPNFAVQIQ